MNAFIPEVKPSTSIRHDYNNFSKLCHETHSPIIITKNGEADLVVMSVEAYQKMTARQELSRILGKIDKDIAAGAPMRDFEEAFADIEVKINNAQNIESLLKSRVYKPERDGMKG
jgi:prevent-host-death family protein